MQHKLQSLHVWAIGWITGTILPIFDKVTKDEIIFWLQVASFLIGIVAGIMATYHRKRSRK